jgi:hypothetical protein
MPNAKRFLSGFKIHNNLNFGLYRLENISIEHDEITRNHKYSYPITMTLIWTGSGSPTESDANACMDNIEDYVKEVRIINSEYGNPYKCTFIWPIGSHIGYTNANGYEKITAFCNGYAERVYGNEPSRVQMTGEWGTIVPLFKGTSSAPVSRVHRSRESLPPATVPLSRGATSPRVTTASEGKASTSPLTTSPSSRIPSTRATSPSTRVTSPSTRNTPTRATSSTRTSSGTASSIRTPSTRATTSSRATSPTTRTPSRTITSSRATSSTKTTTSSRMPPPSRIKTPTQKPVTSPNRRAQMPSRNYPNSPQPREQGN